MAKKPKKRKKVKFKTVTFKLTQKQQKSLDNYCRTHKTTPIKVIKAKIEPMITKYVKKEAITYRHPQQLTMFDVQGFSEVAV
jgi:hypothetical protein